MSEQIDLQPVWNNQIFQVHRGKLKGRTTLGGQVLGHGLIYYMGPANIQHTIPAKSAEAPFVLSATDESTRCIWNPGNLTQVRNVGTKSVDLLRVTPRYQTRLIKALPKNDLTTATALLLAANWSDSFKESVKIDLQAIENLASTLSQNVEPSAEQLLCARAAQQDIEFKLRWIIKSFRKPPAPHNPDFVQIFGGGHGGKGLGTRIIDLFRAEPPYDGSVRVKIGRAHV